MAPSGRGHADNLTACCHRGDHEGAGEEMPHRRDAPIDKIVPGRSTRHSWLHVLSGEISE